MVELIASPVVSPGIPHGEVTCRKGGPRVYRDVPEQCFIRADVDLNEIDAFARPASVALAASARPRKPSAGGISDVVHSPCVLAFLLISLYPIDNVQAAPQPVSTGLVDAQPPHNNCSAHIEGHRIHMF